MLIRVFTALALVFALGMSSFGGLVQAQIEPSVTITATDGNAAEAGLDPGTFTVSRSGDTTNALTVDYAVSGTAAGSDYAALSGSVTIAAGASSAAITVTPVNDSLIEGPETVMVTLSANPNYTVGSPNNATVTIADDDQPNDLPVVSISATDASAAEAGLDPGTFTVTRAGDTTLALVVSYTISGTATAGSDYAALSGSATIAAGASTAAITVTPIDEALDEDPETVVATLSASVEYTVGSQNSATVTIADDENLSVVTITATDANAAEAGLDPGTFTVSRSGDTTNALTVDYAVSGTAAGSDYAALNGSVTIAASASSAAITVTPVNDSLIEGPETVMVTLSANPNYTVGSPNNATVTIADDDQPNTLPVVSIDATDAIAAEAGLDPGTFTVTRAGDTTLALVVSYTVSGTATAGSDYAALSGSATIAAGASSATITVTPIDDSLVEGPETVVATLVTSVAYTVGSQNSAMVTIADFENLSVVTVTATDANAAEAGLDPGTFTVSRSGDTTNALTVNYAVSGTATAGSDYAALSGAVTIAAGASSATITVTPIDDALVEGSETVVATLSANANYTVGSPNSATVTIADDDGTSTLPVVTVVASDANAAEAALDPGTFTVSRSGDTTNALTVNYAVSGAATAGSDYAALSGAVTIAAGASSATITVTPIDDALVEGSETVIVTLSANANYTVGSPNSATVTIADDEEQGGGGHDGGTRPGWGCGDTNHEHSGPPGNSDKESPCDRQNNGPEEHHAGPSSANQDNGQSHGPGQDRGHNGKKHHS